jgi:hypothetical protein
VLSAPAIRYWIPFLHMLGEAFERLCCDFRFEVKSEPDDDKPPPPPQDTVLLREQSFMMDTAPAYRYVEGEPQLTTLLRIARIDEKTLRSAVNLGGHLATMATSDAGVYGEGFRLVAADAGASIGDAAVQAVMRKPQVRETLVGDVERQLIALRRRVDEGRGDQAGVETVVERQITDRMQDVGGKMEQMLADANRASAKTIKDLEAALAKQDKRSELLEKRLAKLEKGGS